MTEPTDTELLDAMEHHGWRVWWHIADDTWVVDPFWPWRKEEYEVHGKTLRDAMRNALPKQPAESHEGSQT